MFHTKGGLLWILCFIGRGSTIGHFEVDQHILRMKRPRRLVGRLTLTLRTLGALAKQTVVLWALGCACFSSAVRLKLIATVDKCNISC